MNAAALLERSARLFPRAPALIWGTDVLADFATLRERVAGLAASLARQHQPGARIGLYCANDPAMIEVMLACWWAGLAAVPINRKLHTDEAAHILRASGAERCISDGAHEAVDVGVPFERLGERVAAPPCACHAVEPDDLAWLFYTSGTTGLPKGAMLTHDNLLAMSVRLQEVDSVLQGDALLHACPISHGSGLYMLPWLARGAAQVVPRSGRFDEEETFDLLAHHPRTSLFAAPTVVKRMARWARAHGAPIGGLRTIIFGGGPMYREDLLEAFEVFGDRLAQIYGQGESPMTITCMGRDALAAARSRGDEPAMLSVGTPFSGIDVELRTADGDGVAMGELGEICVRGPTVAAGYWEDEAATARTFGGGWLRTGDLGRMDASGMLTLSGRTKEVIITGGSNVYPVEVENVLLQHPGVLEVAVVGVRDAEWGERVEAYVVGTATPEELDATCRSKLARFKRPRAYHRRDDLPKNAYGKVVKHELV